MGQKSAQSVRTIESKSVVERNSVTTSLTEHYSLTDNTIKLGGIGQRRSNGQGWKHFK